MTAEEIKAETAYRHERTKRDFLSARRRERKERAERRLARRALRPTAPA